MVLTHPGPPVLLASWWTPEASGEARTTPLNRSQGPWTAHLGPLQNAFEDDVPRGLRPRLRLERHQHQVVVGGVGGQAATGHELAVGLDRLFDGAEPVAVLARVVEPDVVPVRRVLAVGGQALGPD